MAAKDSSPKNSDPVFNTLAETMIQTLRELADRGEKLSTKAICDSLAQKPELVDIIASPDDPKGAEREADSGKLNRLTEQKKELLRRLEELEERTSQKDDLSRRAILTLIRLSESGRDGELSRALADFKTDLINEAEPEELEDRLRDIKNQILQESPKEKAGGSGLSRLFKSGAKPAGPEPEVALEGLRQTYLDLLGEIDLDLGPEYRRRMAGVIKEIRSADDLDHLLSYRPRITQLIHTYAHLVHEERQEEAAFIAEMAQRMSEMESRLMASLDHTREWAHGETAFRADFISQIDDFTAKARRSSQLEELRKLAVTRLSSLKMAVDKKEKRDTSLIGRLENELESVRLKMEEANREAEQASRAKQDLQAKLNKDPLTGALNRGGFEERVAIEMGRFQRYGRPWSLIMIDIDHFKNVNDTFGHPAGDAVLKELVNRLSPQLRKTDLLARYGGEEFVVIMPETTIRNAFEVAQKLRQVIEVTEFLHRGRDVPVTISLGVTQAQEKDLDAGSLVARADKALYKAKQGGRNMVKMI